MSKNNTPAFPCQWENAGDLNATAPDGQVVHPGGAVQLQGMTLRDYFAAKAMPLAWKAEHDSPIDRLNGPKYEHIAGIAYLMADAMLKARTA